MKREEFDHELNRARTMMRLAPDNNKHGFDYWAGYMQGLRRNFHGNVYGTPEEHNHWMSLADDNADESRRSMGRGYRDGLEFQPAAGAPTVPQDTGEPR